MRDIAQAYELGYQDARKELSESVATAMKNISRTVGETSMGLGKAVGEELDSMNTVLDKFKSECSAIEAEFVMNAEGRMRCFMGEAGKHLEEKSEHSVKMVTDQSEHKD